MNNPARAGRGAEVIALYQRLHPDDLEQTSSLLGDLLSDLMHYCHREGPDWTSAADLAAHHFEEELGIDGD